jgi:hypothetical protein
LSLIFTSWDGGEILLQRPDFIEVLFMVEFTSRLKEDVTLMV